MSVPLLLAFGLAMFGSGVLLTLGVQRWASAVVALRRANAERRRVVTGYRAMRDGRNADNLPADRYTEEER